MQPHPEIDQLLRKHGANARGIILLPSKLEGTSIVTSHTLTWSTILTHLRCYSERDHLIVGPITEAHQENPNWPAFKEAAQKAPGTLHLVYT